MSMNQPEGLRRRGIRDRANVPSESVTLWEVDVKITVEIPAPDSAPDGWMQARMESLKTKISTTDDAQGF